MAFGQENKDEGRKDFTLYDFMDRGADSKYPSWTDGAPNLQTYLNALNKSQPIIQCQFELVWSRWPRTLFFAKGITIPGVSVNTLDLNHAGFTIKIPTHVTYETTEITLNIIADKEGFHYYDLRNMVLQTGHPLVAGDPKSTIGNPYGLSPDEDTIEVRLRNQPSDETHHHWVIHNFKPTELGDLELSVDGSSFVEFELKGTFTHITYDCGQTSTPEEEPAPREEDTPPEEPEEDEEEEDEENPDEEDEEEEEEEDDWDDQDEWDEEDWDEEEGGEEDEDEDEEEEATLDDDDERAAYEALQNAGDKDRDELKAELEEKFRQEKPNQDPEIIEARAEFALDAAEKYAEQHPSDNDFEQSFKGTMRDAPKPRLILYKNKCGWIGEDYGTESETLARAVRYNHKLPAVMCKIDIDDVEQELENYGCKTTQLTLPQRFGMYKTPTKDVPKFTDIELEDPPFFPDSTSSQFARNPNHKVRSIFD